MHQRRNLWVFEQSLEKFYKPEFAGFENKTLFSQSLLAKEYQSRKSNSDGSIRFFVKSWKDIVGVPHRHFHVDKRHLTNKCKGMPHRPSLLKQGNSEVLLWFCITAAFQRTYGLDWLWEKTSEFIFCLMECLIWYMKKLKEWN